ncbi:hypothetical protein SAMN05660964_01210 [Thiothrix caldifontis]|uniref:Uncharacterized protein n=2 Tax=Thiothrix caldifontis TaxID=525918 RepID=A0A1H3ZKC1_9GAMM|nr:hypothetical protein SAMN05660964_01210 [Thiothrix caldifontis]
MLFKTKIIVPETHRGLLFKDEQFVEILPAGVHTFYGWKNQYRVQQFAVTGSAQTFVPEDVVSLADLHADKFAAHLQRWETGEQEVGLLYQDNVLKDIKPPAQRGACWQGQRSIEVRKLDISTDFKLPKALASQLLTAKDATLRAAALNALVMATIPEGHTGFLEVDGEQREILTAGTHVWWQFNHTIKVTQLDCRL